MARVVEERARPRRLVRRARPPGGRGGAATCARGSRSSLPTAACSPTRSLSGEALAAGREPRGPRPRCVQALATGTGSALARTAPPSRTTCSMWPCPSRHDGRVVGVSRVAMPLDGHRRAGGGPPAGRRRRAGARLRRHRAPVRALLVVPAGTRCARSWTRPASSRPGNLGARIRVRRDDELGELARILNHSADQLQERLTEIARDRARTEAILSAMDDGVLAVDHRGDRDPRQPRAPARTWTSQDARRPPLPRGDPPARGGRRGRGGPAERRAARGGGGAAPPAPRLRADRRALPRRGGHASRRACSRSTTSTERRRLDAGAARLRGQRLPRAAHAPHLHPRLRGGPRGRRRWTSPRPPSASSGRSAPTPTGWRRSSRTCSSCRASSRASGRRSWEEVHPLGGGRGRGGFVRGAWPSASGITLAAAKHGAPTVVTDADRLRRILENLVENAVKYTPAGGRVT